MNNVVQIKTLILSSILLLASSATTNIGSANPQQAENFTSQEANQTKIGSENLSSRSLGTEGSQGEQGSAANLTKKELDPVLKNLFSAREVLLRGNLVSSLDAMNNASRELFKVNISLAATDNDETDITFTPLQKQIEFTRTFILQNNSTNALKVLNNADVEFIKISEKLPP